MSEWIKEGDRAVETAWDFLREAKKIREGVGSGDTDNQGRQMKG